VGPPVEGAGTQFTCFTSTKVQILTQRAEWVRRWREPVLSLLALLVYSVYLLY
jgi:hypothetical protein